MWKTGITKLEGGKIYVQGYELTDLMRNCSFADVVLLMTTGKMPRLNEKRLMEAILVSCCDQGPYPPSTNATRFVASCGVPLQAAVAAGMLAFGDYHGGAIENCAKLLQEKAALISGRPIEDIASEIVRDHAERKERIPGFGHAYFEIDPRCKTLLEIAENSISPHSHIDLLVAVEGKLSSGGDKRLAANINGAIGAAISDLGIDWRMGRGIFIISRSIGLVVHAAEEVKFGQKYKKIDPEAVEYDGPENREVPLRLEPS
jgi:citrate synthase